jgi:hypothetical protein
MASGFTAAQTGRTHDRTRPMLQQLRKFLPRHFDAAERAPSTASKADIGGSSVNVRFTPKSGHASYFGYLTFDDAW